MQKKPNRIKIRIPGIRGEAEGGHAITALTVMVLAVVFCAMI